MRDAASLSKAQELHPAIRDEVIKGIADCENQKFPDGRVAIRIAQGLRTIDYQNHLYAVGRTEKGANATPKKPMGDIVTKAKGGSSWHNYGLAFDFCLLYDKDGNGTFETLSWDEVTDFNRDGESDWKEVVDFFKALGYEWGGDWTSIKDDPHLEKRFGMPENCSTAFQKYENKDFIQGTEYINV